MFTVAALHLHLTHPSLGKTHWGGAVMVGDKIPILCGKDPNSLMTFSGLLVSCLKCTFNLLLLLLLDYMGHSFLPL